MLAFYSEHDTDSYETNIVVYTYIKKKVKF